MSETKKLKVVRGNEQHPELVREWLKRQGATDVDKYIGEANFCYYGVKDGLVVCSFSDNNLWSLIDFEVVELEQPKPEHKFKPFERVLVRNLDNEEWRINHFSHIGTDFEYPFMCERADWAQCIPFEGNEHLLNTTDRPKKGGEQ